MVRNCKSRNASVLNNVYMYLVMILHNCYHYELIMNATLRGIPPHKCSISNVHCGVFLISIYRLLVLLKFKGK